MFKDHDSSRNTGETGKHYAEDFPSVTLVGGFVSLLNIEHNKNVNGLFSFYSQSLITEHSQ